MNWYRTLVILVVIPTIVRPSAAGLFDKHPRPDPALRVPLLIGQVRGERDEHKRAAAAEELRHFDAQAFPEIIPVLLEALQNDPAAGVRLQAMHSLSSFRPVSQTVGAALEQAQASDKSLRVRLQARTTLVSYRWSGYHAGQKVETQAPVIMNGPRTTEPPLAVAPARANIPVTVTPAPAPAPLHLEPPLAGQVPPLPLEPPSLPALPGAPPGPPQGPDLAPPPF